MHLLPGRRRSLRAVQRPAGYLPRNHSHLKAIKLLLDHDNHGIAAAKKVREKHRAAGYKVEIWVPRYGKDWNARLKYKLTGVLEEVKPPRSKENPTKKKETNPMAN